MSGIIGIQNHKIICFIGCNPEEKVAKQEIFVTVKVRTDFSRCIGSDEIGDTCNYVEIADLCTTLASGKRYSLLESLAHDILSGLFSLGNIEWASVVIKKPAAISSAEYAWVELERCK